MKQGRYTSRWKPRWFVLEDSKLEYFDRRAQSHGNGGGRRRQGTEKKVMGLDDSSVCSFTDTENCFCVATGDAQSGSVSRATPQNVHATQWLT